MALTRFTNRKAAILWVFGTMWLSFLLLMTWELLTDGFPSRESPYLMLAAMALFWLVGVGLMAYSASLPCVTAMVDRGFLQVTWRYPFHTRRTTFGRDQVERAMVIAGKDSEGDPYFTARVPTPGGRDVNLAESSVREECETACTRFNQAFFG